MFVNGNKFGAFGCGLVTMANVYSSLSPYECSPMDMLEYARSVSDYYPTASVGAIGWEDMDKTLKMAGLDTELFQKGSYEEFREQMQNSRSVIVCISSAGSTAIWKGVRGHYVNLYLYQPDTDQVFLTDPGSNERNRSWVALQDVYDSLKTASQFQYLCIRGYEEEKNQWKWNQISHQWVAPPS